MRLGKWKSLERKAEEEERRIQKIKRNEEKADVETVEQGPVKKCLA